ncbi:MAG: MBL fold metallo-hydrolase [Nitriliruptoraceae bacterium]
MLLTAGATRVLVDATRDVSEQLTAVPGPTAVTLTHGHRDASGGVPKLAEHVADRPPLPVFGHPRTHRAIRGRTDQLDHVELVDVEAGRTVTIGEVDAVATEVPHDRGQRFPTFAWRFTARGTTVVYASDVAELTDELKAVSSEADVLVLDGAMYGRSLFSHLRIDEAVPVVCRWPVDQILLTQIGRTAPPHEELRRVVRALCPRAQPAYDGLHVELHDE